MRKASQGKSRMLVPIGWLSKQDRLTVVDKLPCFFGADQGHSSRNTVSKFEFMLDIC